MTQLARTAVFYARMGISVFPLMPREKKPYAFTTGLLGASAVETLTAARWAGQVDLPLREPKEGERLPKRMRASPLANIGIATGAISGFWVLDTDGEEAEQALAALVAVHGPLPATPEQVTGNGRHRCFAWDPAFPIRNSAGKIGPHIDVRGDGGYIVAPPSIHPSGRQYAWAWGRAPDDLPFAPAPEWLVKLAMPAETRAPVAASTNPRPAVEGWASRYGEAALTGSCRELAAAPEGQRNNAIFLKGAKVGELVAGGEIVDQAYALEQLRRAGAQMCAWGKREEDTLVRGFSAGLQNPRLAPELRGFQPAMRRASGAAPAAPSPAAKAVDIRDARALWASARPADCGLVRSWFKLRGLDAAALPGALGRLRAVAKAPLAGDAVGPALLLPLAHHPDISADEIAALAVLPLYGERIARLIGDPAGAACFLTAWSEDGALLVTVDLQDAWSLGVGAHESGHELGVVLAPTLRAFAGGPLGDKYGRVDPATPHADPADAPWTVSGERAVFLAVRGDLRTPELKSRKTFGGTDRVRLEGEAAARFYGGLAEQAWRAAGANQVRILRPNGGAGFNSHSERRGMVA